MQLRSFSNGIILGIVLSAADPRRSTHSVVFEVGSGRLSSFVGHTQVWFEGVLLSFPVNADFLLSSALELLLVKSLLIKLIPLRKMGVLVPFDFLLSGH